MDLIRRIAFAIEEHPHGFAPHPLEIEGYTEEQVNYHVYLMINAGLVNGHDIGNQQSTSPSARARSLTWAGHEFVAAARSDTLWNKAKKTVQETVGSVSLAVLTELLQKLGMSALGLASEGAGD